MTGQELRDRLEKLIEEYDSTQPSSEIVVTENVASALETAQVGATLRLTGEAPFVGNFILSKPVTIVSDGARIVTPNGQSAVVIAAPDVTLDGNIRIESADGASTNDLVVIQPGAFNTRLAHLLITGNGSTKRGIAANGKGMLFENLWVQGIGRKGQESQAVCIWDGTALTIRDSVLQAGSTSFMAGGAAPTAPNYIPSDIVFEGCTLTHDESLRWQGYACKTGFELKCADRVRVSNCTIENIWQEAQTGYAFTFTPAQYGNSPETTVRDVIVSDCVIRRCGGGLNALGYSQHQAERPTQRGAFYSFVRNRFEISKAEYGGHGALMQLGIEPSDILWQDNDVLADGDAFLRAADVKPILGFQFLGNRVNKAGTYGVFTPLGSRGARFLDVFPSGVISGNTFTGAHSLFKSAFPDNVYQ